MRRDQMSRPVALTALTVGAALAVLLFLAPTAHASCAPLPSLPVAIDEARAAFVGTVTATTNQGRWATVEVTDVWTGEVGSTAEVRGGPKDPGGRVPVITSVDRTYKVGKTYLFVPYDSRGSVYLDNGCTATRAFHARLEKFNPQLASGDDPEPRSPAKEDRAEGQQWWAVGAVAFFATALGLRLRARRNDAIVG